MLEQIRKNVRNPYIQAVLGLLILVFIFFFGWGMKTQKPTYVAKVNGDSIDYRSYQQAYNGLVKLYQDAYKGDLGADRLKQLGLGRRALDQLVDRALLLQEADRRDIEVDDDTLAQAIQGVDAFKTGGQFSRQQYLQILEANRLSPLEYEQSKRQELLLQGVEKAVRDTVTLTDDEVEAEYRERHTEAKAEFVALRPEDHTADVKIDDEALADFYDAEKESFRTPERRAAHYLLFDPTGIQAEQPVTDQEIADEYNWRAGEFAVTEAVHARHILLRVPPDAKPAEDAKVKAQAEKLRKKILAGADFAALAKKYSADPGSKDKGGDLGFFERGRMVPEFETAAFSLGDGELSNPVKTSFGYHLIRVEEHREARQETLDEVRDRVAEDIRHRKALEETYAAADNLLMDLEDGTKTWDAPGEGLDVKTTAPITIQETVPGVAKPEAIRNALFSMAPDAPGQLVETDRGTYLVAVASVEPAQVPPLEKVRTQVETRYRKVEAKRLAKEAAEKLLAGVSENGWGKALKTAGLEAKDTDSFTAKGGAIPKIGWAPELKKALLACDVGAAITEPFEINGAFYVARLTERTEPDLDGLDAERETIRNELLPKKQSEAFQAFLEKLKSKAEIEINEDLLIR